MSSPADREPEAGFLASPDDPDERKANDAQVILEAMARAFAVGTPSSEGLGTSAKPSERGPVPARASRVGMLTIDHRGIVRSFSSIAAEIFGVESEDVVGRGANSILVARSEPKRPVIDLLLRNGQQAPFELDGRRRNGTLFPLGLSRTEAGLGAKPLIVLALWDLSEQETADAEQRKTEARYRSLIEQIPAVTFMAALTGDVIDIYVSPQIEALLGYSQEQWLSDPFLWFNQLHPDDRDRCTAEFARGCRTGGPFHAEYRAFTRTGEMVWIHGEARVVRDEAGRPMFIQGLAYDITKPKRAEEEMRAHAKEMEASLAEKEVLLKEIHHRVKNNLQVISSLLKLQSSHVKDPAALEMFNESRGRVHTMALLHEKLCQSQNLSRIDFGDYIQSLTKLVSGSYAGARPVTIRTEVQGILLSMDVAVPLGMIINELVTNSLKYAFPSGRTGTVEVSLRKVTEGNFLVRVVDDGIGFPEHLDFRSTGSLGMQLVCTLTDQIGGSVEVIRSAGTEFRISFRE